ncbi:MAG: glycoside hydrolase family 31 protein [Bacteroidales bacterium]|nr:glycoside hydrolase family 31 protein [Bacteroidales bacterium]
MKRCLCLILLSVVALGAYAQQSVTVQFYTPSIVRIVKGGPAPAESFAVTASPQEVAVKTTSARTSTTYASASLKVVVDRDGLVRFLTPKGRLLLREGSWGLERRTSGADRGACIVRQTFLPEADEPFYGLGILQDGRLNLRGKTRYMVQGNTEDFVPIVQSLKGYAIFWDNPSPTTFRDDAAGMSFESEVGRAVDYYFILGGSADGVIAGIRELTGATPMLPRWSFGFLQSRERYKTSRELLEVLGEYRRRGIPLDGMIQDWQYWGSNYLWNAMEFLSEDFRDAQAMIDEVHAQNAHLMISVWSSFGPMTRQFLELREQGHLLDFETWPPSGLGSWPPNMDYPSGVRPYDPFSAEARDLYWRYLSRMWEMGIDAWWMDSTEPDHGSYLETGTGNYQDKDFEVGTAMGSFRSVRNAFPIAAVGGVYEHQRAAAPDRRVCILTRSAYAGQQRTGAQVWSGDVPSNWETLRHQVGAGLGFALTGNPHFNTDLGGFFANAYNLHSRYGSAVQNDRFRELYVRWTQYGVFSPMMRSHGTEVPREIYLYGKAGEPVYDALVSAVRLRYSLMPYIYSTEWEVASADGTFQRALVMDFPQDRRTWDLGDEYLFGRSLLVAPVLRAHYTSEQVGYTDEKADFSTSGSREVYLPAGTDWYDFWTGERLKGGRNVSRVTRLDTIPVYVRAGGIVPLGPDVQYDGQKGWDELEVRVYPGADGRFVLYEDEGDGYAYERGVRSEIEFSLHGGNLTIGARKGSFPGMPENRVFRVVTPDGLERSVSYGGTEVTVKL